MNFQKKISFLIDQIKDQCTKWVLEKDNSLYFVDPLEQREISGHYGTTHTAVAFIILGQRNHDEELRQNGIRLLSCYLDRWSESSVLPDFHGDFNLFALCIAEKYLQEMPEYSDLVKRIKKIVLSTKDSRHDTVNWIPMRWYVNKKRWEWTNADVYKDKCQECAFKIKKAIYSDGFIDDRLPKGLSFNLQYDIATVAVLQFLRTDGETIDISKETGALLNAVAPDGDINYFGRGTNQAFAWGLWIYLLSSGGLEGELETALAFCSKKIISMLHHNNLMLNEWDGNERYLWWDYHFVSVYTAHLLLWLVLSLENYSKKRITPKVKDTGTSGVRVIKKDGWFVVTFSGRSEYLAERGPCIAAVGMQDGRMLVKGSFAPWQGSFGKKHSNPISVFLNTFGPVRINRTKEWTKNRLLKKICSHSPKLRYFMHIEPIFSNYTIKTSETKLEISWTCGRSIYLNLPFLQQFSDVEVAAFHDESKNRLIHIGKIRNQYDWIEILQTDINDQKESIQKIIITKKKAS